MTRDLLNEGQPIRAGDVVSVEPKNPLESTAIYGLIVMLITIAVKKWVPTMLQDQSMRAALELLGYGIGAAMVFYGRWRATRPLGLPGITRTVEVKLLPFALLLLFLTSSSGCSAVGLMSRAEHDAQLAGIKRAEGNESDEYLAWSAAIAQQPGALPLPDLSKFSPEAKAAWHNAHVRRRTELDAVLSGTPVSPVAPVPPTTAPTPTTSPTP